MVEVMVEKLWKRGTVVMLKSSVPGWHWTDLMKKTLKHDELYVIRNSCDNGGSHRIVLEGIYGPKATWYALGEDSFDAEVFDVVWEPDWEEELLNHQL